MNTTEWADLEELTYSEHEAERVMFYDQLVDVISKLYPTEWLVQEELGKVAYDPANKSQTRWIEPAWKLGASNKALLAVLWRMFPEHPNLLTGVGMPDLLHKPYQL